MDLNIGLNVTSKAGLLIICMSCIDSICCLLTNVTILAMPVKIFDFDSDKMTWIWNRSSKEGWVSSGNMGGRTGQSLLKSFSITEEREAIVL